MGSRARARHGSPGSLQAEPGGTQTGGTKRHEPAFYPLPFANDALQACRDLPRARKARATPSQRWGMPARERPEALCKTLGIAGDCTNPPAGRQAKVLGTGVRSLLGGCAGAQTRVASGFGCALCANLTHGSILQSMSAGLRHYHRKHGATRSRFIVPLWHLFKRLRPSEKRSSPLRSGFNCDSRKALLGCHARPPLGWAFAEPYPQGATTFSTKETQLRQCYKFYKLLCRSCQR